MMKLLDKYGLGIMIIFFLTIAEVHMLNNDSKLILETFAPKLYQNKNNDKVSPLEITKLEKKSETQNKDISLQIDNKDPLTYMKLKVKIKLFKEEIFKLYLPKIKAKKKIDNKPKFSNTSPIYQNGPTNKFFFGLQRFKEGYTKNGEKREIKPHEVGKIGNPLQREYHSEEVLVPFSKLSADSIYIHYKNNVLVEKFEPKNILSDNLFWCSEGDHGLKEEVKFTIEFDRNYRLNAMWIHWAFAPGEFQVRFSNDNKDFYDLFGGFRFSIKNGDMIWWKSVLSNPITRWKFKSFDERINFNQPIWAKYVEIIMRIPVNQYFGIYKVEFYTKSKSIVMLKSLKPRENICISVINGVLSNFSPVLALDCLQGISYGDNRELWVLNSNGYITTYRDSKCLESPSSHTIDIIDCGLSADYKDDREKWILDYDGKIRSSKEQYTCLSLVDDSFQDLVPHDDTKASASSIQSDSLHDPHQVFDRDVNTYWASDLSKNEVIFEIYFHKYPYVLKEIEIHWKFPAKQFIVIGLLLDGYWNTFAKISNNRETKNVFNLLNYDIVGIKIIMRQSTTKLNDSNIYGINNVYLHTGAKFLRREPCKDIINNANLWQIIDVDYTDDVVGMEYKKVWAELHKTRTKFKIMEAFYKNIPDTLLRMKEKSAILRKNLIDLFSNFEDVQFKLLKFEDFLKSEKITIFTIAANEYFPAIDCAHIIKAFPSKRSGFYWIKNECTPKPLRVYCDFDSYDKKTGLDYLIYNEYLIPNSELKNIKKFKDIRVACAKLGLEPIQIKNTKMLKIIYSLLNKMNFNLNDNKIVPLAYDYNCDFAKCSGLYKSLNDENSSEINDILTLFAHNENKMFITKNIFEDNGQIIKNIAAFGLINSVVYLKLEDYPVSAIICSTNDDGSKKSNISIDLECDFNLRSDLFSNFELYTNLRVVCPKGCASDPSPIYGSGIYTDNSSICKAAIHAGVISDLSGGILELNLEPGRKNYIGSLAHNIDSLDYPDEWDKSFRVKKYNPYCPVDKMREFMKARSFLELENKSEVATQSEFVDLFKEFLEKSKINKNQTKVISNSTNKLSLNTGNKSNSLEFDNNSLKLLSTFYSFLQSKKNGLTENQKLKQIFTRKLNLSNLPVPTISNQHSNLPTTQQVNKVKKLVKYSSPEIEMTTQEAILHLSTSKDKERTQIDTIKKIGSEFKSIIGKASYEVTVLQMDKELGLNNQKLVYKTLKNKISGIHKRIFEIIRKSKQKISLMEHLLKIDKAFIDKFMIRDQYQEDYVSKSIFDNYEIINNKKGVGEPAKWDYYMYNLDGHSKTILQKESFIDSKSGSHLVVKNRDFYDFELKFSVLIKDSNTFGIAFRYKDPYNYYIVELSKQDKGFKRVRKFVQGNSEIIDLKYDGGYNVDVWYNFKIRGIQSKFVIYMTDQQENIEKRYEKILEFTDNELVHGTIAFASYGINFLLLDNISVIPISCTNFDERKGEMQIVITPSCPRFTESLIKNFINRWKIIDPLDYIDGPSNWVRKYNEDNREILLYQTSRIYSSTPNEEGTIYLLKDHTKICMIGKFSIKFKASNDGIVGIVFRRTEQNDYYLLEIGGESEKFVRLRKKMDGIFQTLSTKPLVGYSINNWTYLILYMNNEKFNAYITSHYLHDNLVKLWDNDIVDTDLKFGYIGLTTYKTAASFIDIELRPFDDLDEKEELLYVDEESIEMPKRKLSDSLMGKINTNISGFSWSKCLAYPTHEDRLKYCNVLYHSEIQLNRCKENFCETCCLSSVDSTNPQNLYLCNKQCRLIETGNTKNKSWRSCVEPKHQEQSIYPYCEKIFEKDYFQKTRCKIDMCKLCCISFDAVGKTNLANSSISKCYKECIENFDKMPESRKLPSS